MEVQIELLIDVVQQSSDHHSVGFDYEGIAVFAQIANTLFHDFFFIVKVAFLSVVLALVYGDAAKERMEET